MGVGKWINNIGGMGGIATVVLVALAAAVARWHGTSATPPLVEGSLSDMAGGLGVMCFAFIGIELASTMSDEIRHRRDVPRAVAITGVFALVAHCWSPTRCWRWYAGELGAIQGVMQAVQLGADAAGAGWLIAPIALVMALSVGGSASAWFAGPSRIPFVAGIDHALPAALGRLHPKWGSPYVAPHLRGHPWADRPVMTGSSVAEPTDLPGAAVVINPFFVHTFQPDDTVRPARTTGGWAVGSQTIGDRRGVLPTGDVGNVWIFELKMAAASWADRARALDVLAVTAEGDEK
jgi:hypothetical protein